MIDFSSTIPLLPDEPIKRQFAYSIHYVAPEVLLEKGVGFDSDMWSLGAVTYTLLCGEEPFGDMDNNITRVRQLVLQAHVNMENGFWSHVSPDAKNFVQYLMLKVRHERMTAAQVCTYMLKYF